ADQRRVLRDRYSVHQSSSSSLPLAPCLALAWVGAGEPPLAWTGRGACTWVGADAWAAGWTVVGAGCPCPLRGGVPGADPGVDRAGSAAMAGLACAADAAAMAGS